MRVFKFFPIFLLAFLFLSPKPYTFKPSAAPRTARFIVPKSRKPAKIGVFGLASFLYAARAQIAPTLK